MGYYPGKYGTPELIRNNIGSPNTIKFYNSEKIGHDYENNLFVEDANTGSIYHIDLDVDRSGLQLQGPLKDKIVGFLRTE